MQNHVLIKATTLCAVLTDLFGSTKLIDRFTSHLTGLANLEYQLVP
jgi:hypothetical protein